MIQNPIVRVLSVMRLRKVRCLLMGGQACVLYGGAEFSRDVDFVMLASAENLLRLKRALSDLRAVSIAVPPMRLDYLRHRGNPTDAQVRFWLLELRTPILLRELAARSSAVARRLAARRPLLRMAMEGAEERLAVALRAEEDDERRRDEAYWRPLRRELELLRHAASRKEREG